MKTENRWRRYKHCRIVDFVTVRRGYNLLRALSESIDTSSRALHLTNIDSSVASVLGDDENFQLKPGNIFPNASTGNPSAANLSVVWLNLHFI